MRWILFLLFPCLVICADDEIIVHVNTAQSFTHVALCWASSAQLTASYHPKDLKNILNFDLAHNGRMQVIKCQDGASLQTLSKEKNLDYLIELDLQGSCLSAALIDVHTGKAKQVKGIDITGNLAQDRCKLHQIADTLHQWVFGYPGIASSHILYTVRTRQSPSSDTWTSEVWECDYDGANKRQITHDGHLCVTPTYLYQDLGMAARNFLFVSYKVGQPKIYLCNTQSGTLKRLCYLRGNQLMPAVCSSRQMLAFISDIGGNPDLFIQSFSPEQGLIGKPRQLFTAPMSAQGTPTFSPDGKFLAFVSNKDGTARIYKISVDDPSSVTLISKRNRENSAPCWSADGTKLAYCAQTAGVRQIWIYDLHTKEEWQLTTGSTHKENPTWAADSLHLMFNSATDTTAELYLINLNQKEALQITSGPGEKRFPSWEPQLKIR
ncbi:MAG: Tol-Pal system protein TolB [Verrucomicrobia bacterium]|nr:Tol-Pal system protein TolB [Verrucomicrobiota bacterium]MBS0645411.1 Tol-Pal system protein TolB [Verrucomicrobiota bacterium]